MGAQEPGCGTKLAAGPWAHGQGQGQGPWTGPGPKGPWTGPGPMGPWPTPPTPGPRRQFCATAWLLGPHMYPFYVSMCVHMYIDVSICMLMYAFDERSVLISKDLHDLCEISCFFFWKNHVFEKSFVEIFWIRRFVRNVRGMLLAWFSIYFIFFF